MQDFSLILITHQKTYPNSVGLRKFGTISLMWFDVTCYRRRKQEHIEVQSDTVANWIRQGSCCFIGCSMQKESADLMYCIEWSSSRDVAVDWKQWLKGFFFSAASHNQPANLQIPSYISEKRSEHCETSICFFGRSQAINYIVIFRLGGMLFPQRMAHRKQVLQAGLALLKAINKALLFIM